MGGRDTRTEILNLRGATGDARPLGYEDFPPEIKPRKRGKRGGIRTRLRKKGTKPALPTIILGNVRSLPNKMEELETLSRYMNEYRDSCLLAFTETWLKESIPDNVIDIPHFDVVRGDRTEQSGKSKGGGVCLYINQKWCNNWDVKEVVCLPDIELITVGLRPFYLPREFPQIFITVVYIHPRADVEIASELLAAKVNHYASLSPDAPTFIMGDFNQCHLNGVLPTFEQYIDIPTRNGATLDKCYGNIPKAYVGKPCHRLGKSDHQNIRLLPAYKQKLKRSRPVTKQRYAWTDDSTEELRAAFDCTDWDLLFNSASSLDEATDAITSYVKFCVDTIIPRKTFKMFPNNKPWVTKELRDLLKVKNGALINGNKTRVKEVQREIKRLV